MDTNGHESLLRDVSLPHAALVYSIVGSAIEVLRGIGHGLHEKPYENALVVEFGIRNLGLEQQRSFEISYKGVRVGQFIPDLLRRKRSGGGCKSHRTNHQRRAWADAELSAHHRHESRCHPELPQNQARMGAHHLMNLFVPIRVHSWFQIL